ncbi:MAG: hypothetical protein R3E96_07865 [Planctomycetota bacterium]
MVDPRHTIQDSEGRTLGVLTVTRNWRGMVIAGEYSPEKGEKLLLRREPGLQRAQFSLWTGDREWLGLRSARAPSSAASTSSPACAPTGWCPSPACAAAGA